MVLELWATSLFVWLISHQPSVLFSQNKSAISNQPTVLFSQNKTTPAISHQPNEQAEPMWRGGWNILGPAPVTKMNDLFLYVVATEQMTFNVCIFL
jgi:hypothetical protein